MSFIPVNQPVVDEQEKRYLVECIDQGWLSSEGPFVGRFEEQLAASVGRRHGIAVSSGSAALEVAVAALGIGPGDEVIAPTFTIISSLAPIVRAGAIPVLIDAEESTWTLDVTRIESRITPRTKAIMVVHIYGLPVDMAPVIALADRHGLAIIEDAAEAHGQTCHGRPCGSFGQLSIFSFYANKHVTTGEGGMVLCDDDVLAERCRKLRNLCFDNARRFVHEELGWNYRMTNMQAAVGIAQLDRLPEIVARKREMGRYYTSRLKELNGLKLPRASTAYAENIYWVYGVVLEDHVGFDAGEAMGRLRKVGVGTRPFFWPMHEQPVFRKLGLFQGECYPLAQNLARRGFYLPSGTALVEAQMEQVCDALYRLML